MSSTEAALIASAVTGLLTLLGSIVTGVATYKAGKKRVQGEIIGTSRQEWIGSLRDCLAEFQSLLNLLNASFRHDEVLSSSQQNEKMSRAGFLKSKAELLLNPEEKGHQELVCTMRDALNFLIAPDESKDENLVAIQERLTEQAQSVMKGAWEQIKNDIE